MDQDNMNMSSGSISVKCNPMQVTGIDGSSQQEEQWETKYVNDVSMSDINRAVNDFITGPGSCKQEGDTFVKQEAIVDDLWERLLLQSNSNTNIKGTVSSSSNRPTLESRSLHTFICLDKEVDVKSKPNTRRRQNSHTHKDVEVRVPCKDPIQNSVEDLSSNKLSRNTKKMQDDEEWVPCKNSAPKNADKISNRTLRSYTCKTQGGKVGGILLGQGRVELDESPTKKIVYNDQFNESNSRILGRKQSKAKLFDVCVTQQLTTQTNQYQCNVCDKTFADRLDELQKHMRCHSGITLAYTCRTGNCREKLREGCLVEHQREFHEGQWLKFKANVNKGRPTTNDVHEKLAAEKPKSTGHPKPNVANTLIVCSIDDCKMKFTTERRLDKHVILKHKEVGFRCMECGKRFGRIHLLRQHENVHKGLKPYKCRKCGKLFHTNQLKHDHIRKKHMKPNTRKQCEICGVVGNDNFMSKHMLRVHFKKRFKCRECKQDFLRRPSLRDHMRMHRGEERYKCDLCPNSSFVLKTGLVLHISGHARKLQCPKCDKVYKNKAFLKYHLLQHEGIKKFCCKECGKTFSHAHYLAAHKLSHGEKGFECAICGGKFNRKDNLKAHIIRHQKTGRKNLKKK